VHKTVLVSSQCAMWVALVTYTVLTIIQFGNFNINRFDECIFQDSGKISQKKKKIASQAEKCIQYTDFISIGVLCTDWGKWRKGFAMHK